MNKLTKIISPSYVEDFKCIGGECEDSCCIGWDIDIDKLTYRRYFRTKDIQMKKEFIKHVYRNDECDSEEVDYGRVKIKDSKWCPFLDEKKLCKIYSNLGEDYLSNVCYSYPRVYNVFNGVYELSLFMSCPEAIRKLLANRESIKFIEKEVPLNKHIIHSYVDTNDKKWTNSPILQLKELRKISIDIIQNRKYKITERLLKLGYELEKRNSTILSNRRRKKSNITINNKAMFQVEFIWEAVESLQVFSEIDSPVFVDLTKKLINSFNLQKNNNYEEKGELYKKSLSLIVEPFLDNNAHIFEHYLVNFIFQVNFPFTENQDMFDGYLMLVVRFAFIRFYMAGIAAHEGKISIEDVVLIIQVYTKAIEHHKTFMMDLLKKIKEKSFDNMAFISTLLG